MGIKGIYGEIGPGERIALSKISIEKFEKTGVPLRIAIDISIWSFQIQAGQGGTNPALRTLYYRLLRLLSISVQPLFVFDGPHKPPVKRNKQTGRGGASIPDLMTKELLKLFGFAYHIAPGEAEAECALLQREGIVDAVLSEDVDTLMFGSGLTFRSWSSENKSGAGTPTHVSAYDAKATKAGKSGLDREGMILVALMSGGDYKTEGIPGCGVKVACEAARAGFGKRLCQIRREDAAAYDEWRADLAHELFTNERKFFRTKRKALQIPEDFPDRKVLGYYTHPVVSSLAKVERLRDQIEWEGDIDIPKLRHFVADAFEWKGKEGAKKFVRGLAPVLLLTKLRQRGDRRNSGYDDPMLTKLNEMKLVKAICGQRKHVTTDEVPELRVIYQPLEIVDIDLDEEEDDEVEDYGRDGLAPLLEDDQIQAYASDDAAPTDTSLKRGPSPYDPTKADKLWIFETIVKVGVPLTVEDYEEALRNPKKAAKQKAAAKRAEAKTTKSKASTKATGGMSKGALDRFVEITKRSTRPVTKASSQPAQNFELSEEDLPPHFLAPTLSSPKSPELAIARKRLTRGGKPATIKEKEKPKLNPWATSQSHSSQHLPQVTKPSRLRRPITPTKSLRIYASLSPSPEPQSIPMPLSRRKHRQPIVPPSDEDDEPSLPPNRTDRTPPRRRRSPPRTNTKSGLSSPLAALDTNKCPRAPLTPQPLNRKIDFSHHSSGNKSSSSGHSSTSKSSYKTAPSQKYSPGTVIDLTSSSPVTPAPSFFLESLDRNYDEPRVYPKLILPSSSPVMVKSSPENHDHDTCTPIYHTTINVHTTIYNITRSPSPSPSKLSKFQKPEPNFETIKEQTVEAEIIEERFDGKKGKKNTRRYIMLRESLPGSWREAGRDELIEGRSRAWRMDEVEVLDLTGE
ncbi:hypothetical protein NHQ30_003195 [Ciborinia camelliae]|nr:hypothetical protein NHQ30_003195 [Ciborinia camelliae]